MFSVMLFTEYAGCFFYEWIDRMDATQKLVDISTSREYGKEDSVSIYSTFPFTPRSLQGRMAYAFAIKTTHYVNGKLNGQLGFTGRRFSHNLAPYSFPAIVLR